MSRFIQVDRDTQYLLPPSVDEWLLENHLARFVVEVIDPLDLSKLTHQYAGRGSAAHHPSVLLGLLIYGYATGMFSSRKPVLSLPKGSSGPATIRWPSVTLRPTPIRITTRWRISARPFWSNWKICSYRF